MSFIRPLVQAAKINLSMSSSKQNSINWSIMSDISDDDELEITDGDNPLSANSGCAGQPDTVKDVSGNSSSKSVSVNSVSDPSTWKTATPQTEPPITETQNSVSEVEGSETNNGDYIPPYRRLLPYDPEYFPVDEFYDSFYEHESFRSPETQRRHDPSDYESCGYRCMAVQRGRLPLRRKPELSRYCTRVKTSSGYQKTGNLAQEMQKNNRSGLTGGCQDFETPKLRTSSNTLTILKWLPDDVGKGVSAYQGKNDVLYNITSDDEEAFDDFWQALRELNAKEKGLTNMQTCVEVQSTHYQMKSSSVHGSSFQTSCKDSDHSDQSFLSCLSEMRDEQLAGTEAPSSELHFE
ncbi:hypothetical protein M514_01146 [Trichuris suis]|uniref:Uncharacterized protein n=1 Tax=Trichuris suis TaxID=68888 RepID=A0A085NN66_9BILA|nr:hypothetical protein M514_01146 [Trichuris suis]